MSSETKLAPRTSDGTLEKLILKGDLSSLNPAEKIQYYNGFCQRLGLDPFTQPFKILKLNGKEVLYCDRSGTQQLSKLHSVSHEIKAREVLSDCYVVTAQASTPDGRHTESIGAVAIASLKGDALCNAMMKAETKAKRRATLDLLGLGVLDETEIETIPVARVADVSDWTEEPSKQRKELTDITGTVIGPIGLEQRKQLTDIAAERGIPTDEALNLLAAFGFKSTSSVTYEKFDQVLKAFREWSPGTEPEPPLSSQIDCAALWISLQKAGDKRFSSKMKQFAHMLDWLTSKQYDISNINSLSDVPDEQRQEYASLLADLYAQTQEKK